MIRTIIRIDEEKCTGCGACVGACHEGAIDMVNGKARLARENFCDGLGDCLPNCPAGAITFEEREAPAYDESAVKAAQKGAHTMEVSERENHTAHQHNASPSCPGSAIRQMNTEAAREAPVSAGKPVSHLGQWPCQIKLVPVKAPFFDGAKLLIAADCTAYAYANLHEEFMRGKVTLVGCPKLDGVDYTEKLTEIIAGNDVKSVTIVRMEVPCCGGLQHAVEQALRDSGKFIPWQVATVSIDGRILD